MTFRILLLVFFALTANAKEVVKETASGGINWTQGFVFATGYGTAKEGTSAAQKRILSRRAAVVDAQRNLLEITKGVRISSAVKTDEAMTENTEIATRVEGIIRGATVSKDHFQNEVATVTMTMPISGEFMKTMYPAKTEQSAHQIMPFFPIVQVTHSLLEFLVPTATAAELLISGESEADTLRKLLAFIEGNPGGDLKSRIQKALVQYESTARFSGLLIDASSVANFELATIPRIRDETGKVIYPSSDTSYDDIVNKRGVTYDFDLQDAIRNQRVAQTPLVIKAVSLYESLPSDLIIRTSDASKIMTSTGAVAAMNKAGVLIVVAI